jgi:hypothetical protein
LTRPLSLPRPQYHDLLRRSKQPPLPPTASTAELAASLDAVRAAGLGSMQAQVLAYRCLLEGPQPHALMMRYMSLVGAWLAHLAGQPEAQTHFSRLPASALTDVCDALALLARSNPKHLISAPEAGGLISRCLCRFLGERELVPSPFVRQSIAELMHTLVQMDEHTARTRGDGFGGFFGSPLLGLIHLDAAADAQVGASAGRVGHKARTSWLSQSRTTNSFLMSQLLLLAQPTPALQPSPPAQPTS